MGGALGNGICVCVSQGSLKKQNHQEIVVTYKRGFVTGTGSCVYEGQEVLQSAGDQESRRCNSV